MKTKGIEKLAKAVSGKGLSPRSMSKSTVQFAPTSSPGPVYLGYDTKVCPTNTVLQAWYDEPSPFVFIGFYLAPTNSQNRENISYMSRRAAIAEIGYGFGIFYLGYRNEELVGLTTDQCTSRGNSDGMDAVGLASTGSNGHPGAGFTQGIIYFDREANKHTPEEGPTANELTYIQAWINTVTKQGYFSPGLYCNRPYAAALNSGLTGVSRWWIAGTTGGPGCSVSIGTKTPNDSGAGFNVDSWQYGIDCDMTFNGQNISSVDLDMSFDQDPSNTS